MLKCLYTEKESDGIIMQLTLRTTLNVNHGFILVDNIFGTTSTIKAVVDTDAE